MVTQFQFKCVKQSFEFKVTDDKFQTELNQEHNYVKEQLDHHVKKIKKEVSKGEAELLADRCAQQ